MTPELALFAAFASLFGVGIFSFLMPKVTDHYKDINYRTLKEMIELKNSEGIPESEKERLNKMIKVRREAYLEKQENLFDEFDNNRKIEALETMNENHEKISELKSRKLTAKNYDKRFKKDAWKMLGLIFLTGFLIVLIAWGSTHFILWFHRMFV